jgi:hypothetical protein
MPDADTPLRSGSPSWSEAFAALPLESPPLSRWPQIAAALPASRPRRHARLAALGIAAAAALAVVALMPRRDSAPPANVVATAPAPQPSPSLASSRPATPATVATAERPRREAAETRGEPGERIAGTRTAAPAASDSKSTALATRDEPVPDVAPAASDKRDAPASIARADEPLPNPAATPQLDRLQAESAQLEALLALARDDAVSSGAVAAVADELADQVALIDAALVQPSLSGAQRTALWQDRVDALRQLAGFETTQRLLAARGERQDSLLVSVD